MRRISRRQFIKGAAIAGGAMMLPIKWIGRGTAYAFYQSPNLKLFKTALRGVGPGAIPVAAPNGTPANITGVTHYSINMEQFTDQLHPDLGATKLWGFNPIVPLGGGAQPPKHLGGIIVAQKGQPIQITFNNLLPSKHIIPVDTTIPGANQAQNRVAVHLHGGLVPWISDGGPFDWWQPNGVTGLSFMNNAVLNPGAFSNQAEYYYPNNQSARMLWYHDHAFGITRINAYAGIASAYVIRDTFEGDLRPKGLPDFIENGGRELPIVVQDKIFVGPNILAVDPTWTGPTDPGSLWYAHTYERNRWRMAGNAAGGSAKNLALPDPSCIPEYFGDTMLVNGTVYPEATVEARRYRLRVLNACNARFLNLQLYVDDGSFDGITLNAATGNPTNAAFVDNAQNKAAVLQIGTEGGFLPKPVQVPTNVPFNPVAFTGSLIMAPAERADLIVDFGKYAGKNVVLYTDAPAPFPVGDPRNDYFPMWNVKGNPVNALTPAGAGPNTRVLMRFKVVAATGADAALAIDTTTDMTPGIDPLTMPPATVTRRLTLNETFDAYGRLIQLLGTDVPLLSPSAGFGRAYTDPPTETPRAGATEIWEIFNTTGDVHPMHFHLVNVQVLNRQPFQVSSLFANGTPNFTGPAVPPDPNEMGWKETVRMYPGTVTRIVMTFNLTEIRTAANALVPTPLSNRTGVSGHEFVWHCHILEHEEHDMMRPLVVTP